MKLLHINFVSLHFGWILGETCFLSDNEKSDIEKLVVPQLVPTAFVIVFCNLLTVAMFLVGGYLIAGYHFYEHIKHDIEDDIELRKRDKRIQVLMAKQDLLWQMHRAKQERRAKQLEKLKEPEIKVKAVWKQDKNKISEQIKARANRIAELKNELKNLEKNQQLKKVAKIRVTKNTQKLEQGQKLLSGCETPITPPPELGKSRPQRQSPAQIQILRKMPEALAKKDQKAFTFTTKVREFLTDSNNSSDISKESQLKSVPKVADIKMMPNSNQELYKSQNSKKFAGESKEYLKLLKKSRCSENDGETNKSSSQNRKTSSD